MNIVVEITRVSVDPPLVDGARASVIRLGLFSKVTTAPEWVVKHFGEEPWDGSGIRYYVTDTIILDEQPMRRVATMIHGGDDRRRGIIPGNIEKPWDGRSPEDCKFQLGQLVGVVRGDTYRIGVVLAQPPTPERAIRMGCTYGDDRYLVGYVDIDEPFASCDDHDHVPQSLLFEAPPDVPEELRRALAYRCLGHEGFPPWTEEATLALRDPDEVIGRVLYRFQKGDVATERTGGTRAALVLDGSVGFLSHALKDANFQVIELSSEADAEARKNVLAHRIVVTKDTPPYFDDAPVLDYGIVGLDAFADIDASQTYADNPAVRMISKAVSEFGLAAERSGYVLMLQSGRQACLSPDWVSPAMKPKHDIMKKLAWTRSTWINEVEAALGETFMIFCEARLAEKNGKKRWARGWWSEFERKLVSRMIDVSVHPVKRVFDRQVAFEEAVGEMVRTIEKLREHVEREFGKVCKVRLGLVDSDVEEFSKRAREAAGVTVLCPPQRRRHSSVPS